MKAEGSLVAGTLEMATLSNVQILLLRMPVLHVHSSVTDVCALLAVEEFIAHLLSICFYLWPFLV